MSITPLTLTDLRKGVRRELNKKATWGTMLTLILVSMLALATSIQIAKAITGDLNDDGKVDGKDIAIVAAAFGTEPGDLRWKPIADVNGDGKIDGKDIWFVARNFGAT